MGAPGCDDAPVVEIQKRDAASQDFTLVVPYYENPKFFSEQITRWSKFSDGLASYMNVVVVDDGSPRNPAENVLRTFNSRGSLASLRLFRIDEDVRWNWLAARNIGVHKASTDWVMLTDMDHVMSERVLSTIVTGVFDKRTIYRFSRVEHTGNKLHPHPNSWFMTRDMFWKVGGYDEALSGYYGTDGEYRRRCAGTAPIRIMTDELVRFEYVRDSSTTRYKRKQPEDAAVKKMISQRGTKWRPLTLTFPYHEVAL